MRIQESIEKAIMREIHCADCYEIKKATSAIIEIIRKNGLKKKECVKHENNNYSFLCHVSKHEECDECKRNVSYNQALSDFNKLLDEAHHG